MRPRPCLPKRLSPLLLEASSGTDSSWLFWAPVCSSKKKDASSFFPECLSRFDGRLLKMPVGTDAFNPTPGCLGSVERLEVHVSLQNPPPFLLFSLCGILALEADRLLGLSCFAAHLSPSLQGCSLTDDLFLSLPLLRNFFTAAGSSSDLCCSPTQCTSGPEMSANRSAQDAAGVIGSENGIAAGISASRNLFLAPLLSMVGSGALASVSDQCSTSSESARFRAFRLRPCSMYATGTADDTASPAPPEVAASSRMTSGSVWNVSLSTCTIANSFEQAVGIMQMRKHTTTGAPSWNTLWFHSCVSL